MIPVLIALAVAYWVAAPDRFTAGARTATGTATRAAGTGARDHWSSGRGDRQLSRTKRRDRWHRAGGVRRSALRVEHGGVIFGSLVRGLSRMTRAALAPVPGAVRDGWAAGQDRHRRRAGNRPVGVALDPPWWRSGTGPGTGTGTPAGTGPGRPGGTARDGAPEQAQGRPEDRSPVESLDDEDTIRNRRTDTWNRMFPKPLSEADRRFWTERDHGYDGPLDQDGRPGDPDLWPFKNYPDQPAGTSPAGTTPHPAAPTGGSMPAPTELRNLIAVQDFAQQVDNLSEASDFVVVAERARTVSEQVRGGGFGSEMGLALDHLQEVAGQFATAVDSMRAEAATNARTAASVRGA